MARRKRRKPGGCLVCGRPLKSPEAQRRGMGETCAKKMAALQAAQGERTEPESK